MSDFLAIAREAVFSPGKVEADRAILEAVADVLRARGHRVTVTTPDRLPPHPAHGTTVFTMAQGREALGVLRTWERDGVPIVNSVDGVLNCHRHRMCERLERAGIEAPETIVFPTALPPVWPAWLAREGGWLKRGDVHATEPDDVRFVPDGAAVTAGAAEFAARGIRRAVLQRHVPGAVVKFYAVADEFFACFPEDGAGVLLAPAQERALRHLAVRAAGALDLEVFGGDAVVHGDVLRIVDLNDWPSYARCGPGAAGVIASRLEARCQAADR